MAQKQVPATANDCEADFLRRAFQQHAPWLRTVVRNRLGEAQAVDDVMQEVALAIFRRTAPVSDHQKVAPWMYRIAVRQTLMYRRSAGRRRRLESDYADSADGRNGNGSTPDPLHWLLGQERTERIRAALARLPPLDRQLLLLKYTEGWNYQQLADHLGVTLHTIEYRLLRARRKLRHELARLEVVEANS